MSDSSFLSWPFFDDSHRALAEKLKTWAEANIKHQTGNEDEICTDLVKKLGAAGWLKYSVPAPWGGVLPKLDVRSLCLCREILAARDGLADFAFAMQGLGSGPISLFGTDAQRKAYLPSVAEGKKIAAFALSEKEAGSDVASMTTSARREGDFYILDGEKTWISNAGIADFYTVFARTGAAGSKGISAFIVDQNTPGCTVSERIQITSPHPLGTVSFKNCKIPSDQLLGQENKGFAIAMATLDVFRSTVGAAALGFSRRALDEAVTHVSKRKLFGELLQEFQLTKEKIADMAMSIDASALLIYRAAWAKDSGAERVTREAAMAKLFATEAAQEIIDQAVQLLGGLGVVADSTLERLYRDIRPLRIYEGTSEVQKLIIAGQVLAATKD